MVKSKKTLKDKLGTPEEIAKKARRKKGDGDGLKQTKLNFNKGIFYFTHNILFLLYSKYS